MTVCSVQVLLSAPILAALRQLLAVLTSCSTGLAVLVHHSPVCNALLAALDPAAAGQLSAGSQPSGYVLDSSERCLVLWHVHAEMPHGLAHIPWQPDAAGQAACWEHRAGESPLTVLADTASSTGRLHVTHSAARCAIGCRKAAPRMAALLRTELAAVMALRVLCKNAQLPSSGDGELELEGALEALGTATVAQASAQPVLGALACAPGAITSLCDLVQVCPAQLWGAMP